MQHLDSVPRFGTGGAGVRGVGAESRMRKREPGHRRHDRGLNLVAREQRAQARLDKDAVRGPRCIWIERGERQDLHALWPRERVPMPPIRRNCLYCQTLLVSQRTGPRPDFRVPALASQT